MQGKLDCKETVALLQTYVDRELSDSEVHEVHFHLEACSPCTNIFRFEAHLKMLVRQRSVTEEAPISLRQRLMQQFAQD